MREAHAVVLVEGFEQRLRLVAGEVVVVPDEELMRSLLTSHSSPPDIVWERTFLRWDRSWSLAGRPASFGGTSPR